MAATDCPSPMPEPIDILLISPGTTAGWRDADAALAAAIERAGATVAVVQPTFRIARHARRGVLATDLAESLASRRATGRALRQWQPRAFVLSTVQAAMLQPRERIERSAIRFDAPPSLNRRGFGASLLHRLGRKALERAQVLLPYGLEPSPMLELPNGANVVALPFPLEPARPSQPAAAPYVLAYAGNPEKKGLDTIVKAWATTQHAGTKLVVTGIEAGAGREFLRDRSIVEPRDIEWPGVLPGEQYRELLAAATAFVSASRYEDYGQAQLEALAAGAPLVTLPSDGPYEALRLAHELEGGLVANGYDAGSLAKALEFVLSMSDSRRIDYRARAAKLTAPYSARELETRVRDRVLPALLGH